MFCIKLEFCFSCRKSRAIMDECMLQKMNLERPYLGYFTEIRVHKTDRPRPPYYLPRKEWKDDRPSLPDDYPREEPKWGSAHMNFN